MSENARNWIVRSVALLAVALLGAWIANNTYWDEITVRSPLRGEAATNPQYAVREFLKALDVKVEEHRSLTSMPPANAVLVVHTFHWDLIESRRQRIEQWVRDGGRLVVDSTLIGSFTAFPEFSGVEREYPEMEESDEEGSESEGEKEDESKDEEADALAQIMGVQDERCFRWDVDVDSKAHSRGRDHYLLCNLPSFGWLTSRRKPLWALRSEEGLQAVRVDVGNGRVTVLNASPFANHTMADIVRGDLFVAATELTRNDTVWLLTETEHPSLLALIWKYGATVVLFFALFVLAVLWRSARRFGPLKASPTIARRSLAEQIRGTGWFILRLGGARTLHAAMVRAVKELAVRRISRFSSMSSEQQLQALVERTGIPSEALQLALYASSTHSTASNQTRLQLYRSITTLETARRALLHDTSIPHSAHTEPPSKAEEATHAN